MGRPAQLTRKPVLAALGLYQRLISPWLGPRCRFHPSCSAYAKQAIEAQGLLRGGRLALWRMLRCHPWHPGGIDYPPKRPGN